MKVYVAALVAFLGGCYEGPNHSRTQDGGLDAAGADEVTTDAGADDADAEAGGDAEASTGALCGVNGRDDCGPFLVCDHALGCVECARDEDCPVSAGRCLEGRCLGCRPARSDCTAGACWTSDYDCHPACHAPSDCPAGTTCDEGNGACVGCVATADCTSGVCSPTKKQCVECTTDSDCSQNSPRCHVATGRCVKCRANDDCGRAAPICDPKTFDCRVGCTSNAQCPGRVCDATTATCADAADAGSVHAGADGGGL
ncbi:hypothetical protein [Labilithrix luteola]|uniref:hypothetical protein n=1 Tax=Labilithrix luteola TaxID=1391654 RepID=UPI0011BA6BC4|nr:hypothetical protein [Labilithrix luteola]